MEEYLKNFKNKNSSKNKININYKLLLSKFLLAVIFFLSSIIFTNISDNNLLLYKEIVLTESLPFTKIKNNYEKLFGKILPKEEVKSVFNGKLLYKEIKDYYEGESLLLDKNSLINALTSGIVVYIGNKENYGNTIIVQGVDGTDIWYGNIENVSVSLYDYIEKDKVIGETKDKYLYLVIKKDDKFIKYEEYKS